MNSNVYQIRFPLEQLPMSEEIPDFARNYVRDLIGDDTKGVSFSIELGGDDSFYKIVLTVPQRLHQVITKVEASGLVPTHEEPEAPSHDETSCTIPRALQVHCFGAPVDPLAARDTPSVLHMVMELIMEYSENPSPAALDYIGWTSMESDPDTDILTVHWPRHT